jgi:hypothetical protein
MTSKAPPTVARPFKAACRHSCRQFRQNARKNAVMAGKNAYSTAALNAYGRITLGDKLVKIFHCSRLSFGK